MNFDIKALPLKRCFIGIVVFAIVVTITHSLLYTSTFSTLGAEDGIMESGGALCFLGASIVFFFLFLKLKKQKDTVPTDIGACWWYLILAALFFFVTGEEISWGQRIFGWATPDWMAENNVQEETTIHNLEIFNAHTKDHELKPFWQSLLTMNRLFSLFWLSWCLLLPLAVSFDLPLVRKITGWFKVPLPDVFHGCLFFTTFAATKFFVILNDPEEKILAQTDEIKESFFAIIFLLVSLNFLRRYRASTSL
ncbi:MAG: hypothetical protein AB8F34_06395 [Akkermansiaceae bacterium]